jgi:hypothetical protein
MVGEGLPITVCCRALGVSFDYLEIFHNRRCRHSTLAMLSPVEYERPHSAQLLA